MKPFVWEEIYNDKYNVSTFRAKVVGGWLVRNLSVGYNIISESMVFVADAPHRWEVEKVK